ncbi:alpha/beta fold hydrolase [Halorubrum sp. JWXQ-INN 858]|uniref:alpha/beta fold hydrolase n=1 Tax=Halorubrum sp. JWXQ-INN 858 TaxID=2690782 RepID=UPI001359B631|nr:alpha/beta hydrolase [Halorubrum sp. JWXQ-INN 858]MWV66051.1 alpha/beta fold hydrolase [Halorubrum sp. JWXQ-INN 858]
MSRTDADASDAYGDVPEDGSVGGLEASFVEVDGVTERVDGIETRFYDVGRGDPVLLLHGGNWSGTASANTWTPIVDALSDSHRVLAMDRLGCGLTEVPDDRADWVYGAELEHVLSFVDTLGLESFHVVGQSRGGGIGGRVAVEAPDRVATLTVVNSATLSPTAPNKDFFKTRALRDAPSDESSPTYEADRFKHLYEQYQYSPHHVTEADAMAAGYMATRPKARRVAEGMAEGQLDVWLDSMEAHMSLAQRRIRQGRLEMPTLVYWGRDDPTVPLTAGISLYELLAKENPRVHMEVVNRAGHHPYREYPEAFVDRIVSFVAFHEAHGYDYGAPETTYDLHD